VIARMRPSVKIGLVSAGYVFALLIAFGVEAIYVAVTSGPDRQLYGGMYAFGDSLLFLAVFGVASVPPTAAAFFFLRPYRAFWLAFSAAALALAATGLGACLAYVAARAADSAILQSWSGVAVLRILIAPLFALLFLFALVFAPNRSSRVALLVATLVEVGIFACVILIWFLRPR
jgi:hypothetical protein